MIRQNLRSGKVDSIKTLTVDGRTLDAGKHKIGIGFMVTGMGKMEFDVTDTIDGV